MPFNGSGTFIVYTPGNPIANGDTSNATYFNNTMTDFATGLSNTMTKDGQGVPTANIPMGNNKLTGLANGTISTDAAAYGQVTAAITTASLGTQAYLTAVSGTNTITATLTGLTAYTAGLTVRFTAAGANTGAVTLNIGSLGAINVVRADGVALVTGDILSSGTYEAVYDGTSFKLQGSVAASQIVAAKQIQPITATVASNALTITLNPTSLDFRSTTLTTGVPNTRTVGSAITLVTPTSGATFGSTNSVLMRLAVIAIDNAGTVELAAINTAGGNDLTESGLISTTAISGSSTSASVFYSTTARTSVAYRVVGYVEITEATAGTYATAPTLVQGNGGNAQLGRFSYIQFPSITTTSGTTQDQTNIPNWARRITVTLRATSTNGVSAKQLQIGAGSVTTSGYISSVSGAYSGNTISSATSTTGFILGISSIAANTEYCQIVLIHMGGNIWQFVSNTSQTTSQGACFAGGGELSLSGTLDRVRLTTVNGTDTFDNGAMSVLVEG